MTDTAGEQTFPYTKKARDVEVGEVLGDTFIVLTLRDEVPPELAERWHADADPELAEEELVSFIVSPLHDRDLMGDAVIPADADVEVTANRAIDLVSEVATDVLRTAAQLAAAARRITGVVSITADVATIDGGAYRFIVSVDEDDEVHAAFTGVKPNGETTGEPESISQSVRELIAKTEAIASALSAAVRAQAEPLDGPLEVERGTIITPGPSGLV